jgi:5-methylcytosine-specific restriction endonuclease McrA
MVKDWRDSREYRLWRVAVVRRDGVCQCCGSIKQRHAHHIQHATYFPVLRFAESNGVTLCNGCHSLLHNKLVGGYRKQCGAEHLERLKAVRDYFTQ